MFGTLAERWNGTSWTVLPTPNPSGTTFSALNAVSCTFNPFSRNPSQCMAVGFYLPSGGRSLPLAEFFNGISWSIIPAQVPAGANGTTLNGVSCVSATACIAVGTYFNPTFGANAEVAEFWDGTTWTVQPTPNIPFDSLSSVSCTFATSCTAVGTWDSVNLIEHWDGSTWTRTISTAQGAQRDSLSGVSCTSPTACELVGQYTVLGPTTLTLAEFSPHGITNLPQPTPSPGRTVSALSGVSCTGAPEQCWAVGTFDTFRGTDVTLGEFFDGFQWNFENTPQPNQGFSPSFLTSVSCTSASACIAVGNWQPSSSPELTLAEQFTGFGPAAWTLTAAGQVRDGAILHPVLTKPRLIGLVVDRLPQHTLVGLVPLGHAQGSKRQIPWNLKVGRKTLRDGVYEVDLRIFTAARKPSAIPGPAPERLVIRSGRVHVSPL